MYAPQVTVDANGEVIVDEKSLFIDNEELKRNQEALNESSVVNGDECLQQSYHKPVKRMKEWPKEETLRFYKALNTMGPDFALMCGLFPGRTRRELKMKFSKEEKVNRALIDRALTQPIQFDLSDLQKDLEQEDSKKEQAKEEVEESKEPKKRKGKSKDKDDEIDKEKIKKPKKKRREVIVHRVMPKRVKPSNY